MRRIAIGLIAVAAIPAGGCAVRPPADPSPAVADDPPAYACSLPPPGTRTLRIVTAPEPDR